MPYKTALALLTLLLAAPHAQAQHTCSLRTLSGQYVFTGQGFIEALQPGVQRMHYGLFVFDGAGKLRGKQSSSRGGKIGRERLEGTYTLDPDCSGTIAFRTISSNSDLNPNLEIHWDVFVTADGKKGHMIRMDEGNMAVRTFEK